MSRKIAYWAATGLVAIAALSGGLQLSDDDPRGGRELPARRDIRSNCVILLGIGKLAGSIVLLLPRLPTLKEWAYAGFTFMWIAATVAHYLAGDGALSLLPVALLGSLAVLYVTRSANRRVALDAGAWRTRRKERNAEVHVRSQSAVNATPYRLRVTSPCRSRQIRLLKECGASDGLRSST